jgi:hypothetical protein
MRDDAPTPADVPKKRRQLHDALDRWLAEWAARDDLTPSERRRVEEERARRKAERKRGADPVLGLLVGQEGMTPQQRAYVIGYVVTGNIRRVCMAGASPTAIGRAMGVAGIAASDLKDVVRHSDLIVAAPRAADWAGTDVWEGIRFAHHRKVPVAIVLPNGREG